MAQAATLTIARVRTVAFMGLEVADVDVEVQISAGLPSFQIVGLPDKAVAESRERVRASLAALGLALPPKRITVNMAPADLAKEGSYAKQVSELAPVWNRALAADLPNRLEKAERDVSNELSRGEHLSLNGKQFESLRRYKIAKKRMNILDKFCENSAKQDDNERSVRLISIMTTYLAANPGPPP